MNTAVQDHRPHDEFGKSIAKCGGGVTRVMRFSTTEPANIENGVTVGNG